MASFYLTKDAKYDLAYIWHYISDNSIESANRLHETLLEKSQMLADNPYSGVPRPDLGPGLRRFPEGSYVILYRPTDYGIEIARVLPHAQDIRRHFPGQPR